MEGWIKLYRKSKENPLILDFTAWGIFTWILLSVNKETGTMFYGRNNLSTVLGVKPTTLRDAIYRLRDRYKVIATLNAKTKTQIRVLNWHKYQYNPVVNATPNVGTNAKLTPTQRQGDATIQEVENKEIRTISKDIAYGNQDINFLIAYMKERLGLPALDESDRVNRMYAQNCLRKFGGVEKVKLLIDSTEINDFWSTRITSYKSLYYKAVQIISSSRDQKVGVEKI